MRAHDHDDAWMGLERGIRDALLRGVGPGSLTFDSEDVRLVTRVAHASFVVSNRRERDILTRAKPYPGATNSLAKSGSGRDHPANFSSELQFVESIYIWLLWLCWFRFVYCRKVLLSVVIRAIYTSAPSLCGPSGPLRWTTVFITAVLLFLYFINCGMSASTRIRDRQRFVGELHRL